MNSQYYSLSAHLKESFSRKIVKLSLDGGFTCPNRDGTLGEKGCIFCSEMGSGEFAGTNSKGYYRPINEQANAQIELLSKKWPSASYIAYFQNYSNTYGKTDYLRRIYDEAIALDGVIGLAIATRPDCIDDEILELLGEYKSLEIFWIEIGLQSIHEKSISFMDRHYSMSQFEDVYLKLKKLEIPVVIHVIFGLPGETREDMLRTVEYISNLKPFGVKFHMLNVLSGSTLAKIYLEEPFELLSREEYIDIICDAIEILDDEITIHRLTGDGPRDILIAPKWILDKRAVLNGINKELSKRKSHQGIRRL